MVIKLKPLVEKIKASINTKDKGTLGILKYGEKEDSRNYIKSIGKEAKELGIQVKIEDLGIENEPIIPKVMEIMDISAAVLPVRPFPPIAEGIIKWRLNKSKDVDNFLMNDNSNFMNCTAEAVLEILKYLQIGKDKQVCIVGRHIGLEIFKVLLNANYSPTIVHSKTPIKTFKKHIRYADVIISATGAKGLIKKDMIIPGITIIDVGLGDAEEGIEEICNITPIKDGVGAVTTAILFKHIFETLR